jgi:lysozyme
MAQIDRSTIDFLKELEGIMYKAYDDGAGFMTIGVGHLIKPNEQHLLTAELDNVDVDSLLFQDLRTFEIALKKLVDVKKLTQGQFNALISFAFNVGESALAKSTLLKKVIAKAPKKEIEAEFLKWNKAGGKVMQGLTNRRKKEIKMYFS